VTTRPARAPQSTSGGHLGWINARTTRGPSPSRCTASPTATGAPVHNERSITKGLSAACVGLRRPPEKKTGLERSCRYWASPGRARRRESAQRKFDWRQLFGRGLYDPLSSLLICGHTAMNLPRLVRSAQTSIAGAREY
jgi:hypothetical protein